MAAQQSATAEQLLVKYRYSVDGTFQRAVAQFRNRVSRDPAAPHAAEKGRYHLYISPACPWSHRTEMMLRIKGLEDCIGVSYVHYLLPMNMEMQTTSSWRFKETAEEDAGDDPDYTVDPVNGFRNVKELYQSVVPEYGTHDGERCSVPILYDKKTRTIVSNESSEIIRMFNSEFNAFATHPERDLYPPSQRKAIDNWNQRIYESVNNGVYKCGFSRSQKAYEAAFEELFRVLDELEAHLQTSRFLCGNVFTEADLRLFPTLFRFDRIYFSHFKCSGRRIADYPALLAYLRDIYQIPEIRVTCRLENCAKHYFASHVWLNPSRVVPRPTLTAAGDFTLPHHREQLGGDGTPVLAPIAQREAGSDDVVVEESAAKPETASACAWRPKK